MKHNYIYHFVLIVFLFTWACTNQQKKAAQVIETENSAIEKYRPQYHFTPDSAWMNDPNGMVYYEDEYHLFYQYYPDSTVWGPMHWGHAVSTDLVHWEHLPIALYPDSLGYIFSGSAVVDWNNSSGLGTNENPPLIIFFTYHNPLIVKAGGIDVESQALAYSIDKGRTWIKYEGNPVIANDGNRDFRDPKVFWNDDIQKWNLLLSANDHVQIYTSDNLINWTKESDFGYDAGTHDGVWECPDLFKLNVGGTDESKWVMIVNINPGGPNGGSGTQYFTGDFDGETFVADSKNTKWIDWGHDNYAGVTWSDVPKEDGRRIFLGWMSNWDYAQVVPTESWRSAMTIPCELSLIRKADNYLLKSSPVKEMDMITNKARVVRVADQMIDGEKIIDLHEVNLNQSRLNFSFNIGDSQPSLFGFIFENELGEHIKLTYSSIAKQFWFNRTNSGDVSFSDKFPAISVAPFEINQTVYFEMFIDAASIEVFVNDGELVMTEIFFNSEPYTQLKLYAEGGAIDLIEGAFANVNSIWE